MDRSLAAVEAAGSDKLRGNEHPATFLIEGAAGPRQVGLALEDLFISHDRLNRELAERAAGSETILGAMQDGLLVVDTDHRITLLNRTLREMFDLKDDSLGQPLLEVGSRSNHRAGSHRNAPDRTAIRRELTMANRQMQMSGVPMKNEAGRTTGAVFLVHDITELKRADEIRKDFVANVSHELRTPLSILRGYIETLRDDPDLKADESPRILEVMDRHSRRLGQLVDDLLALAHLESGRSKVAVSEIDLPKLLRDVVHDWEKKFTEKKLKVVWSTSDIAGSGPTRADYRKCCITCSITR